MGHGRFWRLSKCKVVLVLFLVFGTSCSTFNKTKFGLLGGTADLSRLNDDEKAFYEKNKDHFRREEWADFIYEDSSETRARVRARLEKKEARRIAEEKEQELLAKQKEESAQCADVAGEALDPIVRIDADIKEKYCYFIPNEPEKFGARTRIFPRITFDRAGKNRTYSIYVMLYDQSWSFLHSFTFLIGKKLLGPRDVSKIDSNVEYGGQIQEHVLLNLSHSEFLRFADAPVQVKVFGKRGNLEFQTRPKPFKDLVEKSNELLTQ